MNVEAQVDIHRSPQEVFAFASDPMNDTKWIGGIKEVSPLTDLPVRTGAKVKRVAKFLRKRIEYVMEVEKFDPPSCIVMNSISSPFPMKVTYEFLPSGDDTRARIRLEGEARGFYKLAQPLVARMSRRSIKQDLQTLKGLMEA